MKKRINIFISSAMRELEYDREIAQQVLEQMNVSPVLFELLPALNQSPASAYLNEVRDCDIFVLLLWKSLRSAVAQEYAEAVKANRPILIFLKSLIDDEDREPDLKVFLSELMGETSSGRGLTRTTIFKSYRRLSELKQAIRESVTNELVKFYREPIYTLSREEMYELGTDIINQSERRLYILQQTPSLFLGARDYLADEHNKHPYEKLFVNALSKWIHSNATDVGKEFLHLFSVSALKKELVEKELLDNPEFIKSLKARITSFAEMEAQSHGRFRFRTITLPFSGPMIVGDNRYGIWILGGDTAVSISQEDERFCDILVRILKVHSQQHLGVAEVLDTLKL